MIDVLRYVTGSGAIVVNEWLEDLSDKRARAKIEARFLRLEHGNFRDSKPLRGGVWEMRIDWDRGIAFIMRRLAKRACYCCAVATSAGKVADIERSRILEGLSTKDS